MAAAAMASRCRASSRRRAFSRRRSGGIAGLNGRRSPRRGPIGENRRMRRRAGLIAVVGAAAVLALWAAPAAAASSPEAALAARFAPVIRLVGAPADCGPGEPYVPTDVNLLFGNSEVGLRGPWGGGDLVKVAPSAADVGRGLFGYHLDFPGDALDPGCGYIDWSRRLNAGRPPTVYADVATDPGYPGQIAL